MTVKRRRTPEELGRNDSPAQFKENTMPAKKPANGSPENWTAEAMAAYETWLKESKNSPRLAVAIPQQHTLPGLNLPGKRIMEIPEEVSSLTPFCKTEELESRDHFYISNAVHKPMANYGPAVHLTVHFLGADYLPAGKYATETWTPSESSERLKYVELFKRDPSLLIGPCYLSRVETNNGFAYIQIRNRSEKTTITDDLADSPF